MSVPTMAQSFVESLYAGCLQRALVKWGNLVTVQPTTSIALFDKSKSPGIIN